MNISPDAPGRPALRYPGAKWRLAPWIISNFPSCGCIDSYVEPYGGSAGIMLQLDFDGIKTYNDLNSDLVNFFKVLRTEPDKLIEQIRLTPWSREEYELSHEPTDNPIERARRLFCFCWMGIDGGSKYRSGFRVVKGLGDRYARPSFDTAKIDHLYQVANVFTGVQIESLPAVEVMLKYDTPTTLQYLDPPYLLKTRHGKVYAVEMEDCEHVHMAKTALELDSYVLISGYAFNHDKTPNELYFDLFEANGWQRYDKRETKTNGNTEGGKVESLWLSPKTVAALEAEKLERQDLHRRFKDLPLFMDPA